MLGTMRCPHCRGRKNILGFGMLEKKCPECNGIGWVEDKENTQAKHIDESIPEEIKRKGRPKKAA
jgi:phage FluMu protein Com